MKAELLGYFGNDLMVVNAARVSYDKFKNELDSSDIKLINYLIKHGHLSPFRHPQIQFRIECPIFVERQLFKHQVGFTANSISGRYVDFSDNYFKTTELRKQAKSSKQGSEGVLERPDLLLKMNNFNKKCADLYKDLCEAGVAKEQARAVLPLCLETKFIWTGSLAAYIHLFNLRVKPDAQFETQTIAREMLELVKDTGAFKYSLKGFGYE